MSGLAWLLLAIATPLAPNGHLVADQLTASELAPSVGGGGGSEVTTRSRLEGRDKELFLTRVAGSVWTGDPARDFAHLCR